MAKYQQPVLIYNPASGKLRRNLERTLQRTTGALEGGRLFGSSGQGGATPGPSAKLRLLATSGPGDATRLVQQAIAEGADLILVLGGDGTINEVINGMAHSQIPIGILPAGTANVLAMELGLGSRLTRAVERLGDSVERRIALGKLSTADQSARYFLSMSGVGLDARIVRDLDSGLKARTGKFAYWATGLSQITQSLGQFDARVNGCVHRCGFALASRVRNYGGDLEIARGASLLRDEFELVLFEGSHPLRYAWYMFGVAARRVQTMAGVRTLRTQRVELTGDVPVQIDGEFAGRLPATLEIVPGALTLLIPPAYG